MADEPEAAAAQHPLAAGEQHRARSADGGHHGRVAVDEVRELVPDDGLELGRREQIEQPARHVQARALAREPDEPRVGLSLGLDDDLGLGHVGEDAEAIDDRVQLGRLRRRDRL